MRELLGSKDSSGLSWKDVHNYARDLEREFSVSVVWHLWPDIGISKVWRMALRAEAVPVGAGYRGKVLAFYYELWPNGRQPTLCGAYYRAVIELWSLLEEKRERDARK